jgi:hypothetical protein
MGRHEPWPKYPWTRVPIGGFALSLAFLFLAAGLTMRIADSMDYRTDLDLEKMIP